MKTNNLDTMEMPEEMPGWAQLIWARGVDFSPSELQQTVELLVLIRRHYGKPADSVLGANYKEKIDHILTWHKTLQQDTREPAVDWEAVLADWIFELPKEPPTPERLFAYRLNFYDPIEGVDVTAKPHALCSDPPLPDVNETEMSSDEEVRVFIRPPALEAGQTAVSDRPSQGRGLETEGERPSIPVAEPTPATHDDLMRIDKQARARLRLPGPRKRGARSAEEQSRYQEMVDRMRESMRNPPEYLISKKPEKIVAHDPIRDASLEAIKALISK